MQSTARARINLSALRHNFGVVRRSCPQSLIMAMVKADAYGHGLVSVAQTLIDTDGFAVARLSEALLLRRSGVTQRILLLATLLDAADLSTCSKQHIDVVVHDEYSLGLVATQASRASLRVWLKLDSGMHRFGLDPTAFVEADRQLSNHSGISELTHMTHFSDASDAIALDRQMSTFARCREQTSKVKASLANSAALISRRDTHADWVRPGLMLYGENPPGIDHQLPLQQAMTFSARVVAVREIGPGEPVGYNARWTSTRRSQIATLGIGYGDGYPRHARNGTPVWIGGCVAPVVGQVSMDSMTIDVTDCKHAAVGDEAILWGPEIPAGTVAEYAATISYDLFTSVQSRVVRTYTD